MGLFSKIIGAVAGPVMSALFNKETSEDAGEMNYAAQKEFAQKGLQWKAADARAAGLHPMAVLGSQGASFAPSFQAGTMPGMDLSGLFDDMDSMGPSGQDTTRAQRAVLTDEQREMQAAQIRNQQLQNALLEGQLAEQWGKVMGQPSNPPAPGPSAGRPTPRSGQANTGEVRVEPSISEATRKGDLGLAAGQSPAFRDVQISPQTKWELLNPDLGESFEAYGELLKPFLAMGAHLKRLSDRYPRKNKGGIPRGYPGHGGTPNYVKKPQSRGNPRRGAVQKTCVFWGLGKGMAREIVKGAIAFSEYRKRTPLTISYRA